MPFIITDPCIDTKDTSCVDVCPVDCIHPRKDEPEFAQASMLYIHPEECIDCGACVPACPVSAIYDSPDSTPLSQKELVEANAVFRAGDPGPSPARKRSSAITSRSTRTCWRLRRRNEPRRTGAEHGSCNGRRAGRPVRSIRAHPLLS